MKPTTDLSPFPFCFQVKFISILTPLHRFDKLNTLSLHSANQLFIDSSENHCPLLSVRSLSLDVYMKVEDMTYLSLTFPSIGQLYLDESRFYFPVLNKWFLMVGHDEQQFANQKEEFQYFVERNDLLLNLVRGLVNFRNLN